MKCNSCKQLNAQISWWDKFRYDLMLRLFPKDVADLRAEAHTQGTGHGYKLGFKACDSLNKKLTNAQILAEMTKEELQEWLPNPPKSQFQTFDELPEEVKANFEKYEDK